MNETQAREEICAIGMKVWQTGWLPLTTATFPSVSTTETSCVLRTGISKGSLTPESICKVRIDGSVLAQTPPYKVSSEVKVHLRLYQVSDAVNAVVHAHPPYGTAVCHCMI